jgi:hypothetical protein
VRATAGIFLCFAVVSVVSFATLEPRLDHGFPSMIDDWSAIAKAPDQLRDVLRLRNPEDQRYRPGFVVWNALQWHTLGAPGNFRGPQLWNVLRVGILLLGLVATAYLLLRPSTRALTRDPRWLLVIGLPLVVVTAPLLAIDLGRYGPQEPWLVGGMTLGGVLLLTATDRLLDPVSPRGVTVAAVGAGLVLWSFGVLQKETSLCALALAPFLWPLLRAQRGRWHLLGAGRRRLLGAIGAGVLLPFVPMAVRTVQLSLADDRVYESFAAGRSLRTRFWDQVVNADEALDTQLFGVLAVAAVAALAIETYRRRRMDSVTLGLLVTALAFVGFAAQTGVVASRYYLPPLALMSFAVARLAAGLGARAVLAVALVLGATVAVQTPDARAWMEWSVEGERVQEAIVREAAAIEAGGCRVEVTGQNVELVIALPVLLPLAEEPARDCVAGRSAVVVIDGSTGRVTPPTDPVLARCRPEPTPFWRSRLATVSRCTTSA